MDGSLFLKKIKIENCKYGNLHGLFDDCDTRKVQVRFSVGGDSG